MTTQAQTSRPKNKYKGARVTTPAGRASYPAVFVPKLKYQTKTNEMEYSIEVLFPAGTDLKNFNAQIDACIAEVFGPDPKRWPVSRIVRPLIDQQILIDKAKEKGQDTAHLQAGAFYARFKSNAGKNKPIIVDADGRSEVIDQTKIYGGCFVKVSAQMKLNTIEGKDPVTQAKVFTHYVTPYLQGVQFIKDGDSFGGRASVEEMFEPVQFDAEESILGG